jgi:hypothetical protein
MPTEPSVTIQVSALPAGRVEGPISCGPKFPERFLLNFFSILLAERRKIAQEGRDADHGDAF